MIHRGLEDTLDIAEKIAFVENMDAKELTTVTLSSKTGSTYTQVGALKIISDCGKIHGMLSGGCLEKDIEKTAKKPEAFLTPQTFSTLSPEDKYFGYGTGCRGEMVLEFKRQTKDTILASLKESYALSPVVHIFGAGPDAISLVQMLDFIKIRHRCADYRKDLVDDVLRRGFMAELMHEEEIVPSIQALTENTSICNIIVLMSHNFYYDARILEACYALDPRVEKIGILGPESRKLELITEALHGTSLNIQTIKSYHKTEAKVGIPGMGKGRNAVALAITAWIQQVWTETLAKHTSKQNEH